MASFYTARKRVFASTLFLALALLVSACSGGGGGAAPPTTNAGASVGQTARPSPEPSATATPTPTPVATATPAPDAMGRVVDDVTGQPIAGAVVIVSNRTVIAGPTPSAASASPWPMATTDASGSFDVKGLPVSGVDNNFSYVGAGYPDYPHAQWLEIFSPDGHAAYHGIWTVNPTGTTSLGTIMVAMPSAADAAWLAQINSDRMTIGNPVQPGNLTFDSATLETARFWANEMATQGFYAHQCPATDTMCKAFWLYETQAHSLPSSQNIAFGFANGIAAEAAFTAEVANCPGGNWQKCTYAENTGHYINIMSATYWAGVGSVTGLNPNTQSGNTTPFYVEDFVTPMQFGSIQSLKRGMWGV